MSEDNVGPDFKPGEVYRTTPTQYTILGSWTGELDDEFARKLTELGYVFRIQIEASNVFGGLGVDDSEDWEPRKGLAVLGHEYWDHRIINVGETIAITSGGSLICLDKHFDLVKVEQ